MSFFERFLEDLKSEYSELLKGKLSAGEYHDAKGIYNSLKHTFSHDKEALDELEKIIEPYKEHL